MHTGALYLTSEEHQPITACRLLHTYGIAAFLATFSLTLLSITVSHVMRHKWTLCDVTGYENMLVHPYSDLLLLPRLFKEFVAINWPPVVYISSPAPGARGKSPSYLLAGRNIKWVPWKPAAGLLPCDGPTDAPVPADLLPLLGSRFVPSS